MNSYNQNFSDSFESLYTDSDNQQQQLDSLDNLAEEILDNLNSTPLGNVLLKIASMPEIRKDKVLAVRRKITEGSYDINQRIDTVVEKVLNEL